MHDGVPTPALARATAVDWLFGNARAQCWLWAESVCSWLRRPLPSVRYARRLGEGQRFALQRGSWMSVLVPMVVFSQFVDLLLVQGIIHVAAAPAHRAALHLLLLVVSVWSLVWAVGLRSATRHIDHVLDAQTLTLAIGFKQLCRLPLTAIAEVHRIEHRGSVSGKDWFGRFGLRPADVAVLSSLDPPTLLMALREDAVGARWTCNGLPRRLKRWVAVYVDKPDALRAALAEAIAELAPTP